MEQCCGACIYAGTHRHMQSSEHDWMECTKPYDPPRDMPVAYRRTSRYAAGEWVRDPKPMLLTEGTDCPCFTEKED